MWPRFLGLLKHAAILVAVALLTFLAVRVYDTQRGPPLKSWHVYVPKEMSIAAIDKANWNGYLAAEEALFRISPMAVHSRSSTRSTPSTIPRSAGPIVWC